MPIALPDKLDSLDDLAPNLKPLYVPAEGGNGFVFKDITGMQNAFTQTKEKLQTATAQIAQLADANKAWEGFKLDEVKDLVAKKESIERMAANQPAEIQAMKIALEQSYGGKITAAEAKANQLRQHIEKTVRSEAVRTALAQGGVRQDRLEQAEQLVGGMISVIWDANGNPKAAILGENNMPKFNPETTNEMTPADVVGNFKKQLPEWFTANAGNGGGANGGNTPAPTDGANVLKWTPAQHEAYAKQHGEAALQALIKQAGTKTAA